MYVNDSLKKSLQLCNIDPVTWETNTQDRSLWRHSCPARWEYPVLNVNASLICSWREKEEKLASTSLHSLTTAPSVDEDVLPPSDYTHTWELTSTDCSSVNSTGDSNNNILNTFQIFNYLFPPSGQLLKHLWILAKLGGLFFAPLCILYSNDKRAVYIRCAVVLLLLDELWTRRVRRYSPPPTAFRWYLALLLT